MHSKLVNTYIFHGKSGTRVKYEVYKNEVANFAEVTVYSNAPNLHISSRSVVELKETPQNHLETVFSELQKHFKENYPEHENGAMNG